MNIIANSIFVDNQEEALQFYTDILGFKKKIDEPVGEGFRWLTLVSPNQPDGAQLVLEPNGNPIAVIINNVYSKPTYLLRCSA